MRLLNKTKTIPLVYDRLDGAATWWCIVDDLLEEAEWDSNYRPKRYLHEKFPIAHHQLTPVDEDGLQLIMA